MKFIIHFIVRTAIKNLHFDIVSHDPVSYELLPSLRQQCAQYAQRKGVFITTRESASPITADDIVIANIIPIPK
jgi:hypothetical protein